MSQHSSHRQQRKHQQIVDSGADRVDSIGKRIEEQPGMVLDSFQDGLAELWVVGQVVGVSIPLRRVVVKFTAHVSRILQ